MPVPHMELSGELASRASEAATGLAGTAAKAVKKRVRAELIALVRGCWMHPAMRKRKRRWRS